MEQTHNRTSSIGLILQPQVLFPTLEVILAVAGLFLFSRHAIREYTAEAHLIDLLRAKFWSIGWVLISAAVLYLCRRSPSAPTWAVFLVSTYFVILYGLLFKGTEYGMNGHWGDNGNRLAEICKIMAYISPFQDWYLKDLPSFYPPGWFWLMAIYAKILQIEAYQTIKYGYLLIFLVYPWLLYFSWRKLVTPVAAAAVVVATLFLAYKYMDWTYYENITAGLFLPWWLHYFEGGKGSPSEPIRFTTREYVSGALIGAALFLIYYYWFFMALAAVPVTLGYRFLTTRSWSSVWNDVKHKLTLMVGVMALTSIYWLPLIISIFRYGSESMQHLWWNSHHGDLTDQWRAVSFESLWIYVGVFSAFYLWDRLGRGKLPLFFAGGILTIQLDRIYNFASKSLQSRKVIELAHVFVAAPLALGVIEVWEKAASHPNVRRGIVGIGLLGAVVVANAHTEDINTEKYRNAVGQRVPVEDLAVFDSVDTHARVFLTNNYREACYRPYYLFIPYNNMTAHTGGRYSRREAFLREAAKIVEPELLAYALAYNRYDRVDYVYLPVNKDTKRLEQTLYQAAFNEIGKTTIITYTADIATAPSIFVKRHEKGMYELVAPPRGINLDQRIKDRYPAVFAHLRD
ncbi:MAG: arabinofuranosyltransferase [Candidatus Zixiibacteriota bacterium]